MLRTTTVAAVVVGTLSLCGGCSSGPAGSEPGPFTEALACPSITTVPFALDDIEWQWSDNKDAVAQQPRHKHEPSDLLGTPGVGYALTESPGDAPLHTGSEVVPGFMARTETTRGFFGDRIGGELVSLWQYDETDGWLMLGEQRTAEFSETDPGAYRFDLGSEPATGMTVRYAVLQAEPSCGAHYSFYLAAGSKVVFSDIDATLTTSDDELLDQVADGDHDPAKMSGSVELTQAWTSKGYQMVYLTARPHLFRTETRQWLQTHGYADGPIITAPSLVNGDSARRYKAAWVSRVKDELGWNVVAAYGNAASDIDAYEDAGIDKSVTFTIGPNAGDGGTTAIANEDYTSHIQDYVMQQPDA